MHNSAHELAGKTVKIRDGVFDPIQDAVKGGAMYRIEDWWDNVSGGSWGESHTPAAMQYAIRAGANGLPEDDEVVYGKIGPFGHLVHVSELGEVIG